MKELILTNIGTIVTGKLEDPITDLDTIAIRDGVIKEIGSAELLEKYKGKADIIIFRARKETEDYLVGLYTAAAKGTCFEQQP